MSGTTAFTALPSTSMSWAGAPVGRRQRAAAAPRESVCLCRVLARWSGRQAPPKRVFPRRRARLRRQGDADPSQSQVPPRPPGGLRHRISLPRHQCRDMSVSSRELLCLSAAAGLGPAGSGGAGPPFPKERKDLACASGRGRVRTQDLWVAIQAL